MKEQDGTDGICDSKMSLTLQCHNRKNQNEKSEAIGSTIHSMIKFPTNRWVVTMETSKEALWECWQLRRTAVKWFFMEHQLKTYPLAKPVTYKKQPLTPDRRQALKEKVFK
ncbi:hypothetical protein Tco_1162967 [Tanacetum coccineum]